jgi:hypothetical protein
MTVGPREVATRRRSTVSLIGVALALWSLVGERARDVRTSLSPVPFAALSHTTWPAMLRWVDAIGSGRLFPCVRASPEEWTRRERAARAVATIRSYASPASRVGVLPEVFDGAPVAALAR